MTFTLKLGTTLIIVSLITFGFLHIVEAGGGGGSSSSGGSSNSRPQASPTYNWSRGAANATTQAYNNLAQSLNRDYTYSTRTTYNSTYGWGYTTVRNEPERSDGNSATNGGTPNPAPTPSTCTAQPNLQTIDIFFVPTGAQPAPSNGSSNPYQNIMVAGNELEVGVSYDPIAMIRNTAPCTATAAASSHLYGGGSDTPQVDSAVRSSLFIKTAYAGGGSSTPPPPPRINYFTNQLPFGSDGSFPIRARIDVGNNGSAEWEHYINDFGPLDNGQTVYLRLPVFTTIEVGAHNIEVVTDIRHSVDGGHGCYNAATPASAGQGCVRETSETDNDRSEAFTTRVGTASYRLAVDVSDVRARTGSILTTIPFLAVNVGLATIDTYRYRVNIGSTQFASTTRTTTLAPLARETVRATGSFTVPNSPTTLPLTVCARVATSTEVCDTARLIVTTPQCSDARDNDSDGTQDTSDPGCFVDPLDPTTYDPNDDNEGDMATTSPSVSIEFRPVVNPVRYNTSASLAYIINGPAPMTCTVTGGGTNSPITHTPPRTTGQAATASVTNTQLYTLRCTATVGGATLQFERTTTVDVLPLAQET